MDNELIKAIDRLSATIIFSAIISRNDMKISSIDTEMLKKAVEDNSYIKPEVADG